MGEMNGMDSSVNNKCSHRPSWITCVAAMYSASESTEDSVTVVCFFDTCDMSPPP